MKSRHREGTAVYMAVATALLVACSGGDPGGEPDPAGSDGGSDRIGGTVRVGVENLGTEDWAPWMMDSQERLVHDLVGENLLTLNAETRETEGRLTESWELSEDLLTWTFRLRKGVPFHDEWGEVTAEDVKFTWQMYMREDSRVSLSALYRLAVDDNVDENFEIVNDYEFRIHTPEPLVTLPDALKYSGDHMFIQSKKYWEAVGEEEASNHPVGTGPFKFVSHDEGVGVVLEAVQDHWRHAPSFDTLHLDIVSEEATRIARLQSGDLDLAPIPLSLLPEAEATGLQIFSIPNAGLSMMHFGGMYPGDEEAYDEDAPWIQADDPEQGLAVRLGMSLAIDREALANELLLGQAAPSLAPVTIGFPGDYPFVDPAWEPPPFDPERARELLADGGYPDPSEIEFDFPIFPQGGRPAAEDIAEGVAGMWEENLGLTINRIPMDFPTFRQNIVERTTTGMVFQFTQSMFDEPVTQITNGYLPTSGFAHYYHPRMTELAHEMVNQPDKDARMALARELGDVLREDVTAIPVVATNAVFAASDRVEDWSFVSGGASGGGFSNLEFIHLRSN